MSAMIETETVSSKAWQESGWILRSLNIPAAVLDSPLVPTYHLSDGESLAARMLRDRFFHLLSERGFDEIDQGRCSRIEDVKRRIGDSPR